MFDANWVSICRSKCSQATDVLSAASLVAAGFISLIPRTSWRYGNDRFWRCATPWATKWRCSPRWGLKIRYFVFCQILLKNILGNCVNVIVKWTLTKLCIKNKKLVSHLNSNLWHLPVHLKFEYKKRHEKAYLIARWPYFKLMFPVYK